MLHDDIEGHWWGLAEGEAGKNDLALFTGSTSKPKLQSKEIRMDEISVV